MEAAQSAATGRKLVLETRIVMGSIVNSLGAMKNQFGSVEAEGCHSKLKIWFRYGCEPTPFAFGKVTIFSPQVLMFKTESAIT